ncbi:hypothetical protein A7M79_00680 [Acinetobacter baumannii]|uniref:hypothetical protein n=1 Tax=Acinetobacter baumannii TaxID=470 RepID=UPI0008DE286A|nr:hypothetical protein [Acinetobacter baumannii]OIH12038.1 hypothetical protein A7M79_00680 [Acinetobacter baumannii]
MNNSEYVILASISRYSNKNDFDMALDFINQLIVAKVEENKAIDYVASHFTGVNKDSLIKAWEAS